MTTKRERLERDFEHESLQDRDSIVSYLKALTAGFETGAITLSDNDGELSLEPHGLVNFAVRAHHKRDRVDLNFKISWSRRPDSDNASTPRLLISASNGNGTGQH